MSRVALPILVLAAPNVFAQPAAPETPQAQAKPAAGSVEPQPAAAKPFEPSSSGTTPPPAAPAPAPVARQVAEAASPVVEKPTEPAPKEEVKLPLRFYGSLKPTVIFGNGLESFGNPNFVAPTAAANPLFLRNPDATALSLQAQQTRLGFVAGEGTAVKGQVEIDFVDFGKSSPAQGSSVRLRQAYLEWKMSDAHKLTLGQTWDAFSPLNTHSYDIVATMFQAGNSGFMRHQIIYTGTFGDFEASAALGLTSQNLTASLGNTEYGRTPTFAVRGGYRVKDAWVGVSALATRIVFDATLPTEKSRTAAGANAFADLTFGKVNVRAEGYGGQNLNNLGMLVLGQGTAAKNVSEAGGWVSVRGAVAEQHALYLIGGGAAVLKPSDMAIGYQPETPASGTTAAKPLTRLPANGPGIERNVGLRLGYAYMPVKGLSLILEPFLFFTKHKLDAAALAQYDAERKGYGVQAGGMYAF